MGGCTEDNSIHTSNTIHNNFYPADVTQMQSTADTSKDTSIDTCQAEDTQTTSEILPPSTPPPNDPHVCNEPVEYLIEVMGKHLATGDAAIFCSQDGEELGFEDIISTDYHGCQFMSKEGDFGVAALRLAEEPKPLSIFTKSQQDPFFQTINYTELAQGKNWVAVTSECDEKAQEKADQVTNELLDYCPNLQITVTQDCDPDIVIIPGDTPGPTVKVIPEFCYDPITLVENLNTDFLNNQNTEISCSYDKFEADEFENLFETQGYGCTAMNNKEDIILFSFNLDQPLNFTAYDKIEIELDGDKETSYIDMQDGELYAGIIAPCDSNINQVQQLKDAILETCPNYQLKGELKCIEEVVEEPDQFPEQPIPEELPQEIPKAMPVDVDLGIKGHLLGNPDAPLRITEFSNYECGYCVLFHEEVFPQLKENYIDTGLVQLQYKPFPFDGWTGSLNGAKAAECAADQGLFFEMNEKLYLLGVTEGNSAFEQYASDIGADTNQFTDCLANGNKMSVVYKHMIEAEQAGVMGTPNFYFVSAGSDGFVENTATSLVEGFLPYEQFKQIIDQELDK